MPSFSLSLSHHLNAREAKLLADDAHASTLEYIYNEIYNACIKGRTTVTLCAGVSPEIVSALQSEGYSVYYDEDEKGYSDFWVISWHKAAVE